MSIGSSSIGVAVGTGVGRVVGARVGTAVDSAAGLTSCWVEVHPARRPVAAAILRNSRLSIPRAYLQEPSQLLFFLVIVFSSLTLPDASIGIGAWVACLAHTVYTTADGLWMVN